ncbi:MAG: hypothetical protein IT223_06800 [Crocinitomicaceae bacterium]|nr:hypothetical protein [Crocinitomicaceae bacterium]
MKFSSSIIVCLALLFLIGSAVLFQGCKKDLFITDSSAKLEFSTDTVFFDTVFTTIGSTTQLFKVYNRHSENIRISKIALEGGSSSPYRINVDGEDGVTYNNIEIAPGDSLYVFVEVTIDPGNLNDAFVVEDRVLFETNGNQQNIQLSAWGQDAYFHGGPGGMTILNCNEVWNNDKPHVVYGVVAVDSACTLTINEGTQVYVHTKSGLYVYKGFLHVFGNKNSEVVFQGDRLESAYSNISGQWGIQLNFQVQGAIGPEIASIARGGIWLYQSPGSTIQYAILKNGGMGIQVDTTGTIGFALDISNTKIYNMSGIGLWGQGASIRGVNVLSANCGQMCAYFSIGGMYQMDNCTFANYWSSGTRTSPAFALNNYYKDIYENIQIRPLEDTFFRNCIMYGGNANLFDFNEFVLDVKDPENQDYKFYYCLVDTDISVEDDFNHWDHIINQQAPYLCSPSNNNFKISNNSSRMFGSPSDPIPGLMDINQISTGSWKGCYDYTQGANPCAE